MSENSNSSSVPEISFGDILNFVRQYGVRILCYGVFSLVIALLIAAAAFFLLPKKTTYVSKIQLQLPKSMESFVYYNNKVFSANDIVSTAVLRKVYEDNKLADKIDFEDFCELFSITGADIRKALLDASYREKLNNKKITVVELKKLEEDYNTELQLLESGSVSIAMTPSIKFTEEESAKILNNIPRTWFEIYSKQEAKIFPAVETVGQISALRKNLEYDGKLAVYDKLRGVCRNLNNACVELGKITAGSKVALPSGEFLSDLQEKVANLETHRIHPMMFVVREMPEYQSPLDAVSLQTCIMEADKKIVREKAQYEGAIAAVNMISNGATPANSSSAQGAKEGAAPMNVTLDNAFFSSLSTLIQKSHSLGVREGYAARAMRHKDKLAEYESEKFFYSTLLSKGAKKDGINITPEQFKKLEKAMFEELTELCGKVNQMRDIVFRDYVQDRAFYTTGGTLEKQSTFCIPFTRAVAGLIIIVLLLNAIYIGKLFYATKKSE
ncbi:MAG: hypothetical protein IKC77_08595 [Lentisphaeria bacterium]|nr:hypothetical protein [Lentisphaeria bacterium]